MSKLLLQLRMWIWHRFGQCCVEHGVLESSGFPGVNQSALAFVLVLAPPRLEVGQPRSAVRMKVGRWGRGAGGAVGQESGKSQHTLTSPLTPDVWIPG